LLVEECWKDIEEKFLKLGIKREDLYVKRISKNKPVYCLFCKDEKFVVKFFSSPEASLREYRNLKFLYEEMDFSKGDYRVPRPYFYSSELNCCCVVEEFVEGKDIDHYLGKALTNEAKYYGKLLKKLALVAGWLSHLHKSSYKGIPSDIGFQFAYYEKLLTSLSNWEEFNNFRFSIEVLLEKWKTKIGLHDFCYSTIIHGDVTPTNFIIKGNMVYGIDLERMKRQNPLWDVGFMASEIKHYYMWKGKSSFDAEPVVSYFFNIYSALFNKVGFNKLSDYLPFFMAMGYLRIARNPWLSDEHRVKLVEEAVSCLKYGL